MTDSSSPRDVLEAIRRELAPSEGRNRFVPLLAQGRLPRERLRWLAGEEYRIVRSDRRSFLLLATRFPESPAVDFFTGLAAGETEALTRLTTFAAALGWQEADLNAYEPLPGCQAYAAHVAWLALNGSAGDVALALIANFAAWGSYCRGVAEALRRHYGLDDESCGFLDLFAAPAPEVDEQALAVARTAAGGSPQDARRLARLLQAYELMFWNTLAEGVS